MKPFLRSVAGRAKRYLPLFGLIALLLVVAALLRSKKTAPGMEEATQAIAAIGKAEGSAPPVRVDTSAKRESSRPPDSFASAPHPSVYPQPPSTSRPHGPVKPFLGVETSTPVAPAFKLLSRLPEPVVAEALSPGAPVPVAVLAVTSSTVIDPTSFSSLVRLQKGDSISFPTPEGRWVSGKVNYREIEAATGRLALAGSLANRPKHQFTVFVKGSEVHATVLLPDERRALLVQRAGDGRQLLQEKPLGAVVCNGLDAEVTQESYISPPPPSGLVVVPLLDSRPSATAVLYLDFDGEIVTDPNWNAGNTIIAQPAVFGEWGDPITPAQIAQVWDTVCEDFRPFNVSITTDVNRYNGAQIGRRMRCIVTPTRTAAPAAAGVAYRNSFTQAGVTFSTNIPSWAFSSRSVASMAQTISHELGHTLGLSHDGQLPDSPFDNRYYFGHESWGPIMGGGGGKDITQWSRGEYYNANNGEDDLGIIWSHFGYVPDDVGESPAAAKAVDGNLFGLIHESGLTRSDGDFDYYRFTTGGGLLDVNASPNPFGPNLNTRLELRDSAGILLEENSPGNYNLSSRISRTIDPGEYYLVVKAQGEGNPIVAPPTGFTSYGSAGNYRLDGTFSPGGRGVLDLSFNSGSPVDGSIHTIVPAGGGKIYIGGDFSVVNGVPRKCIARLNSDGSLDASFYPGSGANNSVRTIAVQADGKVLIGGEFTTYRGIESNYIERLHPDGTVDTDFNLGGIGANGPVMSIAFQADSKVLIGGAFVRYNGIPRGQIARLNVDGTLDVSFNPGSGTNHQVLSVSVQPDGRVLIGGLFTSYNGIGRNYVARLESNGSLDSGFNLGAGPDHWVFVVRLQGDGKVLIGGAFTHCSGTPRNRIARLNSDGSLDSGFNPGAGTDNTVYSIALQSDGKVLIGGEFTVFNEAARNRIVRLNTDGSFDIGFNFGTGANDTVRSVAVQADGRVVIGGRFSNYNGTPRSSVARLNIDGGVDAGFRPDSGANAMIRSVAVQPDNKVVIGGLFTSYSGTPRNRIARLNSNGNLDTSFDPGSGANDRIFAVTVHTDGKVLIGGYFTSYNGTARGSVARLLGNGGLDATFDPGSGANGGIETLTVQSDGKVLIGGAFTSYNGTARNSIARLNADGSLDTSFNPGSGANGNVYAVAVQPDGKLLIGGLFTNYNGNARNYVARLHSDGGLDSSFNPGNGANDGVFSLTALPDGKVLIGGAFSNYDGTPRNRIARLNGNGSLDGSFDPGSGATDGANGGPVFSVALQTDGRVLIGGKFTSFNAVPRNRIARLNVDGSLDGSFDAGANGDVVCLAYQADGKALIGGAFTDYNGTARPYLLRVGNDSGSQTLSAPGATHVRWLRGGAVPEVEQVMFEKSTDGTTWTTLGLGARIVGGWELSGVSLNGVGTLRVRGRSNGGSSTIVQTIPYSFGGISFTAWAAAAGLTGANAAPAAIPFGDGVSNLLKYAFNLNGSRTDASVLAPNVGTSGLPVFTRAHGTGNYLRFEFLRRIGSGLSYVPQKSTDLAPLSWLPLTSAPTIQPIDSNWERVVHEEPFTSTATPRLFGRLQVLLPQ